MQKKFLKKENWWYTRCASLVRKVYLHGPIGISDLKSYYGGRKRIGYNLDHHKDAGGAIIRNALQQLEASGYVEKRARANRYQTKACKRVDRLATEIFKDISKLNKDLERYA